MMFEPEAGFLGYIRMGDLEILRGICVGVRDRNWGTVRPEVSNLHVEAVEDAFRLTFDVWCREREIHFFWRGSIAGDPQGRVIFTMRSLLGTTGARQGRRPAKERSDWKEDEA